MKKIAVDVAIIGAGSAGLSAYRAAIKKGARAILIESGEFGTTCARHACMPSKLLIAAANATAETLLLDGFGIESTAPVRVNGVRVLERVRRERDRFVRFVVDDVKGFPSEDKLRGFARFLSDTTLRVSLQHALHDGDGAPDEAEVEVEARATVIATGAAAEIPEAYRDLGAALATSDDVFEWRDLPKRIAVVGTGVIALELGQALARLGVDITMFGQGGPLASLSDPIVADYALHHFSEAFPIYHDAQVSASLTPDGRAQLRFTDALGDEQVECFERVLVATGRAPNLQHLTLENTSVRRDAHGVPTFDTGTMQCIGAPIFIAGDADHFRPWLNDASNEGRIAGEGAANWPDVKPQAHPTVLSIVFTDPAILMVGSRWQALDEASIVCGQIRFENQGRARVVQKNHGILRIYADLAHGHILGAEGVAPAGEHLAHLIAWSVQQKLTLDQMLAMPFYHPVFEEGLRTALIDAAKARKAALPKGSDGKPLDTDSLANSVGN